MRKLLYLLENDTKLSLVEGVVGETFVEDVKLTSLAVVSVLVHEPVPVTLNVSVIYSALPPSK